MDNNEAIDHIGGTGCDEYQLYQTMLLIHTAWQEKLWEIPSFTISETNIHPPKTKICF